MRRNQTGWFVFLLISCLLFACGVALLAGAGVFTYLNSEVAQIFDRINGQLTPVPLPVRPTPNLTVEAGADGPGSAVNPHLLITFTASTETLRALQQANIPSSNLVELAQRFRGLTNIPSTIPDPASPLEVGADEKFWVSNEDDKRSFQIDASLVFIGIHAYYWVENGIKFDPDELKSLAETFDEKIYPTDREFFGSEWTPGIDGDPRIYILYARGLGKGIAGYFSTSDEFPPQVHPYSNAHEMFDVNADTTRLSSNYMRLVLAHEFQHMIHWYRDRNEATWLNEGFSELAAFLNGYYQPGFDAIYTSDPDIQLNTWPDEKDADQSPHYGASFLFLAYFLDRFGDQATKAVVANPENGLTSIDQTLESLNIHDPMSNRLVTADDVFLDWEITNYIHDPSVWDGRFVYKNYTLAPQATATQTFNFCPVNPQVNSVHQYGADFIRFKCQGSFTLNFEGSIQTEAVPAKPHSGNYMFWSNRSDESDSTLARTFDFRDVTGPIALDYWTWYELEDGYDFTYLTVSEDGQHWQIVHTPNGSAKNQSGNSYGWGYTGNSGGGEEPAWIHEVVDLSPYAGKLIQLRFETITDAAVNKNGFLLDDLAIPQIGYSDNFETNDGSWTAEGYARINNILPQEWRLALIQTGSQGHRVEYLKLNSDLSISVPFQIAGDVQNVTLMVTGLTRFTTQPASYRFWVTR